MRHILLVAGLAAGLSGLVAVAANAQQGRPAGFLRCEGGPSVGLAIGSGSTLSCTFKAHRRRPEHYVAHITRVGVDVGITEHAVMGWNVFTPTGHIRRHGLAGHYGGVGSSVAVGAGAGSNVVSGGPGNLVSLQPVAMQGQTGLNLAFGFQGMDLTPAR